ISHFIKKLNEELATDFNIEKEISYLNLFDVRELLTAEKIGRTAEEISLKLIAEQKATETAERESKKIEAAEQYILKAKTAAEIKAKEMAEIAVKAAAEAESAQKAAEQADAAQKYIAEVKAKAAIEASNKAAAEAAAYTEKIKMWKDKTQEEIKTKTWKEATKAKAKAEAEIYAISPGGEKVILENPSEGEIVDLVLQGYSLPSKYYIPRHCPKCGNFNQRMIFELTDRTFILMDYPRIYGLKCRCGNCGNEWHQK
ncbi:MAG: hypothetical protein GY870_11300, partial [archaeon]|nr:hypothetical protein [archaeon]